MRNQKLSCAFQSSKTVLVGGQCHTSMSTFKNCSCQPSLCRDTNRILYPRTRHMSFIRLVRLYFKFPKTATDHHTGTTGRPKGVSVSHGNVTNGTSLLLLPTLTHMNRTMSDYDHSPLYLPWKPLNSTGYPCLSTPQYRLRHVRLGDTCNLDQWRYTRSAWFIPRKLARDAFYCSSCD